MAIRDQSYQRYEGPVRDTARWATIGWHGFRTNWGFWRTKLTIFAVWLIPVVFAFLIIAEAAFADTANFDAGGASHVGPTFFIGTQLFALAVVFIARGCGIISDDLRHGTMKLHFSKPISKLDYAAGKLCTLILLGIVAVLAPAVLLVGLRTAVYAQTDALGEVVVLHLQTLFLLVLVIALLSSLVAGISSLTRRTGYAVLGWIAILIVPVIAQVIVQVATDGSPWAGMLSLSGIVGLSAEALMAGPDAMPDEIPLFVPFGAIAALIAAGLGALHWRLSRLEEII